ncbi:HGxxPAAW family protein [Thermopolyspora sp. NPDC052614]|uniref:HGxxPAAW family protein n=1 Tax=Thermopolyspora sp. NPDC052614 TaxID=3155682 RepID=UPI003447BE84
MSEHKESHLGRPKSWIAVIVIFAGFLIGGYALTDGPNWGLFWAGGLGPIVVGGIIGLIVDIYSDVILDKPRTIPAQPIKSR